MTNVMDMSNCFDVESYSEEHYGTMAHRLGSLVKTLEIPILNGNSMKSSSNLKKL